MIGCCAAAFLTTKMRSARSTVIITKVMINIEVYSLLSKTSPPTKGESKRAPFIPIEQNPIAFLSRS